MIRLLLTLCIVLILDTQLLLAEHGESFYRRMESMLDISLVQQVKTGDIVDYLNTVSKNAVEAHKVLSNKNNITDDDIEILHIMEHISLEPYIVIQESFASGPLKGTICRSMSGFSRQMQLKVAEGEYLYNKISSTQFVSDASPDEMGFVFLCNADENKQYTLVNGLGQVVVRVWPFMQKITISDLTEAGFKPTMIKEQERWKTWTDISGKFSVVGKMTKYFIKDGVTYIEIVRKDNKREIIIPMNSLSIISRTLVKYERKFLEKKP